MKEKIYTIPINEAISAESECPFCIIADKLEEENIDYTLGAAMMEPDYRVLCNERGFCRRHGDMLFKKPNKLSLALILDTRTEVLKKQLKTKQESMTKPKKQGFFKKNAENNTSPKHADSCVVCEKINATLKRYAEVFFYMWKNDDTFKTRILNSRGFCMPHFYFLIERADKYLSNSEEFVRLIFEKQLSELNRIGEDIHKFTLKFDYRNKNMEWGTAKDAPKRTIQKLSGCTDFEKQNAGKGAE